MRISKLYLPAAAMVGAVALAGCGGGDGDSMTNMNRENGGGGTGFSVADLPADTTGVLTYDPDSRQVFRVAPDDYYTIPGIDAVVHCPKEATGGCRWRISADNEIEVTNGATVILAKDVPAAPPPVASTEGGGDWLSSSSLVSGATGGSTNAFALERGNVTVDIADTATASAVIPGSGGLQTTLRLRHNRAGPAGDVTVSDTDYLVWGAWQEGPTQDPGPDPKFTVRASGSMPYGDTPSNQLANARYANSAVGFDKSGTDPTEEWSGTVTLDANFDTGYISGEVTTGFDSAANVANIDLKKTKIGASFSGTATVTSNGTGTNVAGSASSGSWEGTFYGPSGDRPTGTAGTFAAKRPKGTNVTAYEIQGAFGTTAEAPVDLP